VVFIIPIIFPAVAAAAASEGWCKIQEAEKKVES
jgi:hypothetical protein